MKIEHLTALIEMADDMSVPWGYCPFCIMCKVPVERFVPGEWTQPLACPIYGQTCYPKCCPIGLCCPCVVAGFNYSLMLREPNLDVVCCQAQYCGAMGEQGAKLCCSLCCFYVCTACAGAPICACIERKFVM